MNVAKWVLFLMLSLPFLELAAFIAVSAAIGFGWALGLVFLGSLSGLMVLRHAGGKHIARVRVALGQGNISALQADGTGGMVLLAGILLLVPGFITDALALLVLAAPLWRTVFGAQAKRPRDDGVVDLPPEQWHQVPDPSLSDRRSNKRDH